MRTCHTHFAVSLAGYFAMTSLAVADEGTNAKKQDARFKITTKRADDSVKVKSEKGQTVFSVKSPFGISEAVIERVEEKWP